MTERLNLEQLEAQKQQLSRHIEKRQQLVNKLTPKEADPKKRTQQETRSLGVADRVIESTVRAEAHLVLVDKQLEIFLPGIIEKFETQLRRKWRDLISIERAVRDGIIQIPEVTLKRFQAELKELIDKPTADPYLKRVYEFRSTPTLTPKVELSTTPEVVILDTDKKSLVIDGKSFNLTNVELAMISYLANTDPEEKISSNDIRDLLFKIKATDKNIVAHTASQLRKKLGVELFNNKKVGLGNKDKRSVTYWSIDHKFDIKVVVPRETEIVNDESANEIALLEESITRLENTRDTIIEGVELQIIPRLELIKLNQAIKERRLSLITLKTKQLLEKSYLDPLREIDPNFNERIIQSTLHVEASSKNRVWNILDISLQVNIPREEVERIFEIIRPGDKITLSSSFSRAQISMVHYVYNMNRGISKAADLLRISHVCDLIFRLKDDINNA